MFFFKFGFNKVKSRLFISSLMIFFIFIVLNSSIVFSSEDKLNVSQRKNINDNLIDFVEKIYINYSEENFQYIYNELHPAIKERLGEKEYIEFQEKNFKKYKLEIGNIDVQKNVSRIKLPEKYTDINIGIGTVYKIKVNYEMNFSIAESREIRQTEKDVIIFLSNNNIYLLWDHSIITN